MAITEETEALMLAYAYGELSASDAAAFERRMDADAELRAEVEGLKAQRALFGRDASFGLSSGVDVPPPHIVDAIMKAEALSRAPQIREASFKRDAPSTTLTARLSRWLVGAGVLVGAAAIVVVFVTKRDGPVAMDAAPAAMKVAAAKSEMLEQAKAVAPAEEPPPPPSPAPSGAMGGDGTAALAGNAVAHSGAKQKEEARADRDEARDEAKLDRAPADFKLAEKSAGEALADKHAEKPAEKPADMPVAPAERALGKTIATKSAKADAYERDDVVADDAGKAAPKAEPKSAAKDVADKKKAAPSKGSAPGAGNGDFAFDALNEAQKPAAQSSLGSARGGPAATPPAAAPVTAASPPPAPAKAPARVEAKPSSPDVVSEDEVMSKRREVMEKRSAKAKKDPKHGDAERSRRGEEAMLAYATGQRELAAKNYLSAVDEMLRAEQVDIEQGLGASPQLGQMRALMGLKRFADAARVARRIVNRDVRQADVVDAWMLGTQVAQQIGDTTLQRDLWTRLLDVPAHKVEARAALDRLSAASYAPAVRAKAAADAESTAPAAAAPPASTDSKQ